MEEGKCKYCGGASWSHEPGCPLRGGKVDQILSSLEKEERALEKAAPSAEEFLRQLKNERDGLLKEEEELRRKLASAEKKRVGQWTETFRMLGEEIAKTEQTMRQPALDHAVSYEQRQRLGRLIELQENLRQAIKSGGLQAAIEISLELDELGEAAGVGEALAAETRLAALERQRLADEQIIGKLEPVLEQHRQAEDELHAVEARERQSAEERDAKLEKEIGEAVAFFERLRDVEDARFERIERFTELTLELTELDRVGLAILENKSFSETDPARKTAKIAQRIDLAAQRDNLLASIKRFTTTGWQESSLESPDVKKLEDAVVKWMKVKGFSWVELLPQGALGQSLARGLTYHDLKSQFDAAQKNVTPKNRGWQLLKEADRLKEQGVVTLDEKEERNIMLLALAESLAAGDGDAAKLILGRLFVENKKIYLNRHEAQDILRAYALGSARLPVSFLSQSFFEVLKSALSLGLHESSDWYEAIREREAEALLCLGEKLDAGVSAANAGVIDRLKKKNKGIIAAALSGFLGSPEKDGAVEALHRWGETKQEIKPHYEDPTAYIEALSKLLSPKEVAALHAFGLAEYSNRDFTIRGLSLRWAPIVSHARGNDKREKFFLQPAVQVLQDRFEDLLLLNDFHRAGVLYDRIGAGLKMPAWARGPERAVETQKEALRRSRELAANISDAFEKSLAYSAIATAEMFSGEDPSEALAIAKKEAARLKDPDKIIKAYCDLAIAESKAGLEYSLSLVRAYDVKGSYKTTEALLTLSLTEAKLGLNSLDRLEQAAYPHLREKATREERKAKENIMLTTTNPTLLSQYVLAEVESGRDPADSLDRLRKVVRNKVVPISSDYCALALAEAATGGDPSRALHEAKYEAEYSMSRKRGEKLYYGDFVTTFDAYLDNAKAELEVGQDASESIKSAESIVQRANTAGSEIPSNRLLLPKVKSELMKIRGAPAAPKGSRGSASQLPDGRKDAAA